MRIAPLAATCQSGGNIREGRRRRRPPSPWWTPRTRRPATPRHRRTPAAEITPAMEGGGCSHCRYWRRRSGDAVTPSPTARQDLASATTYHLGPDHDHPARSIASALPRKRADHAIGRTHEPNRRPRDDHGGDDRKGMNGRLDARGGAQPARRLSSGLRQERRIARPCQTKLMPRVTTMERQIAQINERAEHGVERDTAKQAPARRARARATGRRYAQTKPTKGADREIEVVAVDDDICRRRRERDRDREVTSA